MLPTIVSRPGESNLSSIISKLPTRTKDRLSLFRLPGCRGSARFLVPAFLIQQQYITALLPTFIDYRVQPSKSSVVFRYQLR